MAASVTLEPSTVLAEPGGVATLRVRVRNTATAHDDVWIEVLGPVAAWASVYPSALSLQPGAEGVVQVSIRLPREAAQAAGPRALTIVVHTAGGVETVDGVLDVASWVEAAVDVAPRTASVRRSATYVLSVANRGNASMQASVVAAEPDGPLAVTAERAVVEVASGATAVVPVTVRARRLLLAGRDRARPFDLIVTTQTRSDISAHATLVQRPLLSRPALAAVVVVLVALAGVVVRMTAFAPAARTSSAVATASSRCPARDHLSSVAAGAGDVQGRRGHGTDPVGYSFLFATAGGCQPVRWNPCAPVHYVLNAAQAPAGGVRDIHEAFRRIAATTGMSFVDDGTSTEQGRNHAFYQPGPDGGRWAPVLIYWYHGGIGKNGVETPANGFPFIVGGVIVSGQLGLNVDAISSLATHAPIPDGFGPGVVWGRFMLHELGHVLGLGHVSDTADLMYPDIGKQTSPVTAYSVGDSVGLRLVGRPAGCLSTPTPHPVPNDRGRQPSITQ